MKLPKRYKDVHLSLDELVSAANTLLPDILPSDISDQRIKEELSPRLVRHYSSQGSLEEPLKEGREARYTYRHLLQLLALRRLQAEGHRTGSVSSLLTDMSETELEDLLSGDRQVTLTQEASHPPANPALDFLHDLRSGKAPRGGGSPAPHSLRTPTPKRSHTWCHHELAPGLVLEVREDFQNPSDPTALLSQFIHALSKSTRRKPK